jgi:hypothetical protein
MIEKNGQRGVFSLALPYAGACHWLSILLEGREIPSCTAVHDSNPHKSGQPDTSVDDETPNFGICSSV